MNFPHFFGEMSRGIIFSELQGVSFKLAFLQQQQARFNDEAKWLLYHLERIIERSLKKKTVGVAHKRSCESTEDNGRIFPTKYVCILFA